MIHIILGLISAVLRSPFDTVYTNKVLCFKSILCSKYEGGGEIVPIGLYFSLSISPLVNINVLHIHISFCNGNTLFGIFDYLLHFFRQIHGFEFIYIFGIINQKSQNKPLDAGNCFGTSFRVASVPMVYSTRIPFRILETLIWFFIAAYWKLYISTAWLVLISE